VKVCGWIDLAQRTKITGVLEMVMKNTFREILGISCLAQKLKFRKSQSVRVTVTLRADRQTDRQTDRQRERS
jgi:hypothetical protein